MRYDLLLSKHAKEAHVKHIGADTCSRFNDLIIQLVKQEQDIRSIGIDAAEAARQMDNIINLKTNKGKSSAPSTGTLKKIDSIDNISYQMLKEFACKYGLFQINRTNFPDSVTAFKLAFKYYTLMIHLSDKYGPEIMKWVEQAIQSQGCNKEDLINYTITYLWRQTEFERGDDAYFITPLPDLDITPYAQNYITAISLFISEYAQKGSNKHFEYMIVPNWKIVPAADFVTAAKRLNNMLATAGTAPILNLGRALLYFKKMSATKAWEEYYGKQHCKYYFICNDPGSKCSPAQTFINN